METVNPNNPHTAAYASRIAELEETIRVQGERLKLLDFAQRPDVRVHCVEATNGLHRSTAEYNVWFVPRPGGRFGKVYRSNNLEEALRMAMGLCRDEGCENQPTPHTHSGLPPWKIVLD